MGIRRSQKAGEVMGEALSEMIHLMYQNNTARHFLVGLIDTLMKELERRSEDKDEKKSS